MVIYLKLKKLCTFKMPGFYFLLRNYILYSLRLLFVRLSLFLNFTTLYWQWCGPKQVIFSTVGYITLNNHSILCNCLSMKDPCILFRKKNFTKIFLISISLFSSSLFILYFSSLFHVSRFPVFMTFSSNEIYIFQNSNKLKE